MQHDLIVIKYNNRFAFSLPGIPDSHPSWAIVRPGGEGRVRKRDVDRREALETIERLGLKLTHENKYGKIWDTPDRDFQKNNHGARLS